MATINNFTYSTNSLTLTLNGRRITSFMDGDILTLTPAGERNVHLLGTDRAVNIMGRIEGEAWMLNMNVQRGSEDDEFLAEGLFTDPPSAVIYEGSLRVLYVRDGEERHESWQLQGGSHTEQPTETYNTQEGNQTMSYTIRFRSAVRQA